MRKRKIRGIAQASRKFIKALKNMEREGVTERTSSGEITGFGYTAKYGYRAKLGMESKDLKRHHRKPQISRKKVTNKKRAC